MNLDRILRVPGVSGVALADGSGALLEAHDEEEGEALAAVTAYMVMLVGGLGESLGLGLVSRVSGISSERVVVTHVRDGELLTLKIEPAAEAAEAEAQVLAVLG